MTMTYRMVIGEITVNSQIIAAVVTATGAIVAAIVGLRAKRKKRNQSYDKMALAFRLGFHSFALFYWIKLSAAVPTGTDEQAAAYVKATIDEDNGKCEAISKQLGVVFSARSAIREDTATTDELAIYRSRIETSIAALPLDVQRCVEAGQRVGSAFYRVFLLLFARHFAKDRADQASNLPEATSFAQKIRKNLEDARMEFAKAGLKKNLLRESTAAVEFALSYVTKPASESMQGLQDGESRMHESVNSVAAQITQLGR